MFEKLIDLIVSTWSRLSPWEIIRVYQSGAVLRFGKYHRTLEAGIHWKWPVVEEVIEIDTCVTTIRLPPQTLTTKDGVTVVVSSIIKYQVKDLKPYICDIFDQHDVLGDVSMGAIRQAIHTVSYEELINTPPEPIVLEAIRKEVNQYGFKIHRVTFIDIGKIRSFRLIYRTPQQINN